MSQTGALATQAPAAAEREFRCVCIDIETPATGEAVLHKVAAFRSDTAERALFQGQFPPEELRAALESLAQGADFVLGHNVRRHDLPVLVGLYPGLSLAQLPVVDTLELSPLAFPENPYHRLVKDYKLVGDARNHPMRDAKLALVLFQEELEAFQSLQTTHPDDVALFHYLLGAGGLGGVASLFMMVRRAVRPRTAEAAVHLTEAIGEKVCATRLRSLIENLRTPSLQYSLAYLVAWLRVAGGNSVLPRWVVHTYPGTTRLISELRDTPCDAADCAYCQATHNPEAQLSQYFSLSEFRPQPQNDIGGSLQRDVTVAGLNGRNLLAILPTGAGKSLCYQLPALAHYWRTGELTVVVSPLQSLMKDQVDNLVKRGIYCAVALNGLLTPPERRSVLDKIRLGDAGIVLVSPEQFRNKSFIDAIQWREIAAWVFDEAHCLSRWGHDFRTDYLYVATFIRERYGDRLPPVACFTATAKLDVIADLQQHFRAELGVELTLYAGGHARPNLDYEVIPVTRAEKAGCVIELLREALPEDSGGAVIFAATRKNAETLAELIAASGWACAYFHAGLEAGSKREIQQNFVSGALRVIVATNAFGMGVDKPDVRLVVHADIPGSLENYLQEAGRAGRDSARARCVLLYDEEDVETQFALSARSRLTHRDFVGVLKAIRKRKSRLGEDVIVVTARELLLGEEDEIGFDADDRDAETKVRTAIAWLERARLIRREENQTRVFSASLQVASLQEAEAKLLSADLSDETRERYRAVLRLVMDTSAADGITTDQIMAAAAIPADQCFRTLHNLETLGLLANDLGLRVLLRKGVTDPSDARLARISHIERALVDVMAESAPDADGSSYQVVSLRPLCEGVRERLQGTLPPESITPERLLDLLRAMAQSFGAGDSKRAMLTLRKAGSSELRVRVQRPWSEIREITERRRAAAHVLLRTLLDKVPEGVRSADAIVECKAGELLKALTDDLELAAQLRDPAAALEHALLYLHDTEVLILDKGRTVFRSAMTLKVLDREGGSRFLKEDYAPLERHYGERNFQIHVMHEYAKRGLRKVADALALVAAYFSWDKDRFVKEHFAGRKDILDLATTAESYQRIVEALNHPIQQQLVQAREGVNRLVLAGPGSGKTKVIVHRVAYLLRVMRVPPESIIVLTFNRSAAVEVRRRLRALIGGDATGVTVLTYHAMALRLAGISLGSMAQTDLQPDFDAVVRYAVGLLEGRVEAGTDPDEVRDRLLTGYRFILVDEYQDIDAHQYDLVSALAGRTLQEGDTKLTIMAVGDDDQNIYSFRKTSVEFIRRFEADYEAQKSYLVENFRSTQHIISAANFVIQRAPERMKADYPIRINHTRSSSPPGGRWEALDPTTRGHVQLIPFPLPEGQREENAFSPPARGGVPQEGRGGGRLPEEASDLGDGGGSSSPLLPEEGWREAPGWWEPETLPLPSGEGRGEGRGSSAIRNIQAQLAMLELWRLRQLDPTADWSHFAILARTHAALEPIRAYCEINNIPYRTGDRERGLSATQTREGDLVLSTLRRKSGRMIRSAALRRWLARLAASEPLNPWIADLRDCAADLETAVAGAAVPAADAIDWIYESAGAHAREAPGHLNLLTAHGAKGREFDHVLVLDTGDWPSDQPDERRLLYVAMTRARETLTLFQASQRGNPILSGLEELEAVRRIEPTVVPLPIDDLDRIHRELTLRDIDLGFAGRSPSKATVHRAILELQYGASLQLHDREFKDAHGRTVGKLAKKCELPKGSVLSARVIAVVHRTRGQSPEEYRAALKVEEWETVLAELVIQPDA